MRNGKRTGRFVLSCPAENYSHWGNGSGKTFLFSAFADSVSPETLVHAFCMKGHLNFENCAVSVFFWKKMKNLRNSLFRLLLAASFACSLFVFSGCMQPLGDEEEGGVADRLISSDLITGTWVNLTYGEKYEVLTSGYNNYSHYDSSYNLHPTDWFLYYATVNVYVKKTSENTGYVYSQFNDSTHIGSGATVNQWYAFHYKNLSTNSVQISQAYKAGGMAACNTLEQAVTEFTIANGYYERYSTCVKDENGFPIGVMDSLGYMSNLVFERNKVTLMMMNTDWAEYDSFIPWRDTNKETGDVALYLYDRTQRSYGVDMHYLKINKNGTCYYYLYDEEEDEEGDGNDSIISSISMPTLSSAQITRLKNVY